LLSYELLCLQIIIGRISVHFQYPVSGRKSKKGQITGIHISTVYFVLHCVLVVPLLVLGQLPLPFHFAAFNLPVPELIYQSVQESPGSQLKGGVQ
jgi:hypothetical protein